MILNAPTSTSASTGASDTAGGKGTPTKVLGFREPENPKAAQVTGGREAPGDKEHAVAATAVPIATKDADARPAGLVIWLMCFTSFLGLQLNQSYGTISVVVFLAPWILLMLWRLPQMIRSTFKDYLMLLMPVLAMLSAVWSPDPQATLRLGLQYLATVAIGIAAANLVSRRVVITSLVTTLTLVTLAGLVVSYRTWGMAGLHGTIGLYGSKNFFASSAAIQFIGALYILIHSRNSLFDRLLGLGFLGVALIGVYCGHSAGSTASLGASLAMVFGIQIIRRTGAASVVALTMGLLVGLSALILAGTNVLFADTMQILGKDTSMTGRTELWSTGFAQIQQQPLLGIGYQAFWRIGFPPAEKLWAMFGIDTKSGFNFHNEYINMTVGLGIIGVLAMLFVLFKVVSSSIGRRLKETEKLDTAIHTMFFFFFFLTFVEQEFFYQFILSPIILCLVWSDRLARQRTAPATAYTVLSA